MKLIATIRSPYKQKFGIPRQFGIIEGVHSRLEFEHNYGDEDALVGLSEFSHLWVVFQFHQSLREEWKSTVKPPRLGGQQKVGVWASRAPFRPNGIGLSVGKIVAIQCQSEGYDRTCIILSGLDILDNTPVFDIKPYLPYADAIDGAVGGFAKEQPETEFLVEFMPLADEQASSKSKQFDVDIKSVIRDILSYEIRPAHQRTTSGKVHRIRLYDFDIKYRYQDAVVIVDALW
ncbi:MAG: COG1720: Uncharacterized conserved protein [uncultured Thiotrichaceae bacterium]|uniref:COG1720: Uncharacterized conserved protein n=1 Tax=uncultured Thiotrichaceae bacterium TaxID=298394 RepID=A0A6S6U1V3_9GAMM|nr:MAG: COG1720: Uncharacterized conserved protein [uncultured Thiotrichaceae bacterium]